ncbi:hypothetical protein QM806_27615 [Rhodococcus sp. IEGM 1351]|uniref:hypothetical protein n=1 Tax=Rhodococcus sp. IEGM 1351 TaxID=3047089 RepID=UPI0024B71739|nr:hypothetical protein [Rhodococcus sp. IEGM 1351]MDI9939159.1 hypothetical protein [Rhodococcus sp. IEGM 1351]
MKIQALRTAVIATTTPFLLLAGFGAAHAAPGPSNPAEFNHCEAQTLVYDPSCDVAQPDGELTLPEGEFDPCDAQTLVYDPSCDVAQPDGELTLPEGEFDPCAAQTLVYDPSCDVTSGNEVIGGDGPPAP